MEETLSKELAPGYHADIDEQGTLVITEIGSRLNLALNELEPANTVVALPPQAARALHNFLRREECRDRIGYRKQKEGKRHITTKNTTSRLGYLQKLFRRWHRQTVRP